MQFIVKIVQDFFAGGADTSATRVEWAFQELMRNPNMIEIL